MAITARYVDSKVLNRIPDDNETIEDFIDLNKTMPHVASIAYYFRAPEDCPFARGNWILDLKLKDGNITCFKFPKEMSEDHFLKFLIPLLNHTREWEPKEEAYLVSDKPIFDI